MIGSTISHYVVEDLLGEGGMGKVYRARDTVLNRTVAIKILGTSVGGDSESKRRILREARAACALNHPNVVTIHSVEEERELDFIVMEHVAGAPLTIPAAGLPIDQAIDYAVQITSALAAAHEAGIIHQDIKPANVMVGRSGHVKVLDFGIARRTELRGDAATRKLTDGTLNAAGVVAGTLGYISPEQIAGEQASVRSDIFSLGALLYETLAGGPAFPGQSAWAVMDATVRAQPPSLLTLRRDVPASLNRIVLRCLEKNPEARYPTADAVQTDLLAVKAQRSPGSTGRSRSGRAAIAIGVVLALLAGGAIAWWRVRDSRVRWARETALPEATRLFGAGDPVGAYRLAARALAAAPDDPQVVEGWTGLTTDSPIQTDPAGAEVAFRSYSAKDEGWISLGRTPTTARYPVGQMRWRITKEGYDPIEISLESAHLVPKGTTPGGMVYVPAGSVEIERDNSEVQLPPFWIDQYEVTNRAYKVFVDQGGYREQRFWREPFVKDGRTLSWSEAMTEFHDETGRPGPSTWELGMYPDGQDDWPVSGVSWYEAAAYAAYANKQLPTVYHWHMASGAFGVFSEILRFSNFGGVGTGRVGSTGGLGPYGTYDMAGNVKEWCWNEVTSGKRYVLGGAFNESNYMFRDPDAQPTFERRAGFGFRLHATADRRRSEAADAHRVDDPRPCRDQAGRRRGLRSVSASVRLRPAAARQPPRRNRHEQRPLAPRACLGARCLRRRTDADHVFVPNGLSAALSGGRSTSRVPTPSCFNPAGRSGRS